MRRKTAKKYAITVNGDVRDMKMDFEAAVSTLRRWKTDPAFIGKHWNSIQKFGLELPMEYVIFCGKP